MFTRIKRKEKKNEIYTKQEQKNDVIRHRKINKTKEEEKKQQQSE